MTGIHLYIDSALYRLLTLVLKQGFCTATEDMQQLTIPFTNIVEPLRLGINSSRINTWQNNCCVIGVDQPG